ncbi:AT-rich interactive domain-containing protein 5A isoform X1 [Syngnathus acus]|uniref:AT-rich interactive domain-containing protein 5A isoform X1 n=1 Tax=Syngnathus acus TaxID=161584 RepID=UPI001885EC60|nr:AT-rich interactive domain-containing protein 5A isoform X1 [Syngnathus acus]
MRADTSGLKGLSFILKSPEDQSARVVSKEDMETPPGETSPPVIKVHGKYKEVSRPRVQHVEEKSFVSSLHSFMKERGSPIERIPHLGFKQIDLWMIYKAVEKLGGYNSVTARRLWKKVYDELGGSPTSTSAATCTRRHYERLVLPYERHLKGEDDKPLPLSKPRKPYKRNSGGKIKAEWKGERSKADREGDSERLLSAGSSQSEAAAHPGSVLWSADADRRQPQVPLAPDLYAYYHLLHGPATTPWPANISAVGEVISPLEKKKRLAQASLRANPQGEERDRPSVIHRSASPASGSHKCDSSDGSPRPVSSSSLSSRSPSLCSISSEDENHSAPSSDLAPDCSIRNDDTPVRHVSKDPSGESKDRDQVKILEKNHIREQNIATKDLTYSSPKFKSDCVPTSSSGFIRVLTKSAQLPRPAPIRPGNRIQHDALTHHNKSFKTIPPLSSWEMFRAMPTKFPPAQQRLSHTSCVTPSYDMLRRDSYLRTTLQQANFLPRMRIPQPHLPYRHVPVSTAHSALIYPYPCTMPLWGPHAIPQFYTPHKL